MTRILIVTVALVLLEGCAGKPTTYLELGPAGPVRPRQAAGLPALAVGAIDIPPAIDRLHLTTGAAPGALHVAGDTEWAGPLGSDGADRAGARSCRPVAAGNHPDAGRPDSAGRCGRRACGDPGFHAGWIGPCDPAGGLVGRRAERLLGFGAWPFRSNSCRSRRSRAGQAQSMSVALGELADEIAAALVLGV
jgi:hypothetical protein